MPYRSATRAARKAVADTAVLRRATLAHTRANLQAEVRAVADGVAETVALDEARGACFQRPRVGRGERAKPVMRLDGLAWLAGKGRLSARQVQAGGRYGRLMQVIEGGDVASCLSLFEVRGGSRGVSPTDAKVWARVRLAEARRAVGDHPGLVFALDQICGLGLRPREVTTDQRAAERLEDRLGLGLDLLVKTWGL